ncbi:MAG: hypothetical protein FWG89_05790 [Treponema sp.]|nr:hypothetical protein [Treponema sp.]
MMVGGCFNVVFRYMGQYYPSYLEARRRRAGWRDGKTFAGFSAGEDEREESKIAYRKCCPVHKA